MRAACEVAGIDVRTLQRWRSNAAGSCIGADRRPDAVRPVPAHALTQAERQEILRVVNEPGFADMPPARIVLMLADEGRYIASESSFARVLRAHGQNRHRGRCQAPRPRKAPSTHIATGPNQGWCWDITYLPSQVAGRWFYLYLIMDLYSRQIVGWEVHDSSEHAVSNCCGAPPWPRALLRCRSSRYCTVTTAAHSKPPPCWLCCSGLASNPRTQDLA